MSWFLAFAGFALLIIFHELGHFTAAKAVGMRVERFALFFPPLLFKVKRGETEYGVGAIPLGGYVRITGMNPNEELSPEIEPRAYYKQPVWKRIVVIGAGPAVNFLIAFLLLAGIFLIQGKAVQSTLVGPVEKSGPAAAQLQDGDKIVSIDGKRGDAEVIRNQINAHPCPGGKRVDGCLAATPAKVVVERDGQLKTLTITPRYDAQEGAKRMRLGFSFKPDYDTVGPVEAASLSVTTMWRVTEATVTTIVEIFKPEKREQISGVVGSYETTRQSFLSNTTDALLVLALISLSLAVINLFPFLPLDGGHIFWALAEKVRGRAIPFAWMEKASVVGFMLVLFLFFIGLSNDIDRLQGDGFGVR
jgi:regulator of sigma E protease